MTITFFSRKYFFLVQTECQCENIYLVNLKPFEVQLRFSRRKLQLCSNLKLVTNVASLIGGMFTTRFSRPQRPRRPGLLKPSFPSLKSSWASFFVHGLRGCWANFWGTKQESQDGKKEFGNPGRWGRRRPAEAWFVTGCLNQKTIWCFSVKKIKITDLVVKFTS